MSGRDVCVDGGWVESYTRVLNGGIADVGRENLNPDVLIVPVQILEQRDGERIGFFASGAPRDPGSNGLLLASVLDQLGKYLMGERLERFGLAKESRHVNQQILVQGTHFGRRILQEPDVMLNVGEPLQCHATQQAPLDGGQFVLLEVDSAGGAKKVEDASKLIVAHTQFFAAGRNEVVHIRMRSDLGEPDRDLGRRQHHVDHAGRDSCTRHSVVLRRLRFLRERDPAGRLDLANAGRAI